MSSAALPNPAGSPAGQHPAQYVLRKLPHVTVLFWILKTIAVTLGETAGDEFGITLQVGYVATAAIFIAAASNNILQAVYATGFAGARAAVAPAGALALLALAGGGIAWWTAGLAG